MPPMKFAESDFRGKRAASVLAGSAVASRRAQRLVFMPMALQRERFVLNVYKDLIEFVALAALSPGIKQRTHRVESTSPSSGNFLVAVWISFPFTQPEQRVRCRHHRGQHVRNESRPRRRLSLGRRNCQRRRNARAHAGTRCRHHAALALRGLEIRKPDRVRRTRAMDESQCAFAQDDYKTAPAIGITLAHRY